MPYDTASTHSNPSQTKSLPDLRFAGWFVVIAGTWELLFNRLASTLGIYSDVGALGLLSLLASSGRLAMNAIGIMALILSSIFLVHITSIRKFAPLTSRVILILSSPLYLPIICVAVFRPIWDWLILIGYLAASGSAVLLAGIILMKKVNHLVKILLLLLGLTQALSAFDLVSRALILFDSNSSAFLGALPRKMYVLSEVLLLITPCIAFFALSPGRAKSFIKRPHLLGLTYALLATGTATAIALHSSNPEFVRLIAFRTLGITLMVEGHPVIYLASLFSGAFVIGTMILPSKRWPPSQRSRQIGFGLTCIFLVGLQPTHPYQFALMILGFLYLALGFIDNPSDEVLRSNSEELQPH
jgi:hypothetical protein